MVTSYWTIGGSQLSVLSTNAELTFKIILERRLAFVSEVSRASGIPVLIFAVYLRATCKWSLGQYLSSHSFELSGYQSYS